MSLHWHHRWPGAWFAPLAALVFLLMFSSTGHAISPADYLRTLPAPNFKAGHTLPMLSKWSWPFPMALNIEMATNWGYALDFNFDTVAHLDKALADPNSNESKLCALAASDPKRFALQVYVMRTFPNPLPDNAWTHDATGALANGTKTWSPEAPDSIFQGVATTWSDQFRKIRARAPIAIILNGGEYGLPVVASGQSAWKQDPKVMTAKGQLSWFDYIGGRKAHQEMFITDACRRVVPDRQLFIYYTTSSGFARNRWGGWVDYSYGYKWIKTVGDLPCEQMYYEAANDGWVTKTLAGDGLTQVLNSVGEATTYGNPLSYNFVEAGWTQKNLPDGGFSDIPRYIGFLKCYYTAGMIGGIATYCEYPTGGFGADFDPSTPPHWLLQVVALSQVHALFSHLEPYLRQGDLLPGPNMHIWSINQPAYEFTNKATDPTARVLARKMRNTNDWLVTAWAADGNTRDVTVTIPVLGTVTLNARGCGSVYRATLTNGQPVLMLVDTDGLNPTANM